ncbi:aldehyde dehydrogenase [Backusella circina FSU 941]|nr:aldehyde dehydrogenase [Backusella circina FSU 941]
MSTNYTPTEKIPSLVESLHKEFNTGLTKDVKFRKQQLKNLLRFFEENTKAIEQALWNDLHKHQMETDVGEVSLVVDEAKYMLNNLDKFVKPKYTKKRFLMNTTDKTYIRKEAKGVVLVSQHTAEMVASILPKYLDSRAYTVITGGVKETTTVLEQRFDHIFYTGNGAVGKIVMTAAAKHLTSVTLELGGKSPAFVASDADIKLTAHRLLWGKFFNCGQTCVAPDYVLCAKDKTDELIKAFRETLQEFYGNDAKKSNSYGRIINTRQFDRLKGLLDNCRKETIVIGGDSSREDLFMAPTVIYPVATSDGNLMQDEIFGPILPVIPVENMKEAIQIVNSRDHSLALYVFSSKKTTYNNILDHTNSGGVLINDTLMHLQELSLPFGGVGPSGMGSYHGEMSFNTFTHERSTMVKDTAMENVVSVRYPPYNQDKANVLSALVYGFPGAFGTKISSLVTVCGSMWRFLTSKNKNMDKQV